MSALISFDEPVKLKLNQPVMISPKRKVRTEAQNRLLWVYIRYCIEVGLKECGQFSEKSVWDNIKYWASSENPEKYPKGFTTTKFSILEMQEFINYVDAGYMVELAGIDSSGFWADYEAFKESQKYSHEGQELTFSQWMNSRIRGKV